MILTIPNNEVRKLLEDLDRIIDNYKDQMSPELEKELESIWARISHIYKTRSSYSCLEQKMDEYLQDYIWRCSKCLRAAKISPSSIRNDLFPWLLGIARNWRVTDCSPGQTYPDREHLWKLVVSSRNFLYILLKYWEDWEENKFSKASRDAVYSSIGICHAQLNRAIESLDSKDPTHIWFVSMAHQNLKGAVEAARAWHGQEQFCLRLVTADLSAYLNSITEEK